MCGQKITYEVTKKHLEEIIDSTKGKKVNEIYTEIEKAQNLSKILTNKEEELIELRKELTSLLAQISSLESKCSELADRKTEFGEIGSFLDSYLISLQKRITESNNAFKTKNDHIEVAETEVDEVQIINNVLLKRDEYEAVETRSKDGYPPDQYLWL